MKLETISNLYGKGKYENCLAACIMALRKDPENYEVLSYYASCLIKVNEYSQVIIVLDKLVEMKEGFHLYKFRGDAHYELEEYELAIRDFKKSLELEPDNGACWDLLARAYYRTGKVKKALESIDKAIEISKGEEYDPLAIKVLFLKLEGKVDEAFDLFLELQKKFEPKEFLSREMRPLFDQLSEDFISKHSKRQ